MSAMNHDPGSSMQSTVSAPYASPLLGNNGIWVQAKRAGEVLTGAFNTDVPPIPP